MGKKSKELIPKIFYKCNKPDFLANICLTNAITISTLEKIRKVCTEYTSGGAMPQSVEFQMEYKGASDLARKILVLINEMESEWDEDR